MIIWQNQHTMHPYEYIHNCKSRFVLRDFSSLSLLLLSLLLQHINDCLTVYCEDILFC